LTYTLLTRFNGRSSTYLYKQESKKKGQMDFNLLLQADQAAFELEKARRALDTAKTNLDSAKQNYDEIMGRAEESGMSKAKLKKLVEERVGAIFESGFAENGGGAKATVRPERPKRSKKTDVTELESESGAEASEVDSLSMSTEFETPATEEMATH
jgi:hypothetical protein